MAGSKNQVKVEKVDGSDWLILVNGIPKSRSFTKTSADATARAYRRILGRGEKIDW